jgi:YNFM family putative membrane transporter
MANVDGSTQRATSFIETGTPEFRRTNIAMATAGFSTFTLLWCVQPLMPVFSKEFNVGPAASSLAVSFATGMLSLSILLAGALSEAWGRKPLMVFSLTTAAALTLCSAFVTNWHQLLILRALSGLAFGGLPAIAMAYLSEEMHPSALGLAMGLYIGGSALGGMFGRLFTGILTDMVSWRFAIAVIGAIGLTGAILFWRILPPSLHFRAMPLRPGVLLTSYFNHIRDAGLRLLFAEGFLLLGSFITVYNYISYRLLAPPYSLSQTVVGSIFIIYLIGIGSSAWVGNLASRLGRRRVLWIMFLLMIGGIALTLFRPLAVVIIGVAMMTFGFYGGHSITSSWVGLRAKQAKAQASSLYLFSYYLGSSVVGFSGGFFWSGYGWVGVAVFLCCLLALAFAISLRLAQTAPVTSAPVAMPGAWFSAARMTIPYLRRHG